MPFFREDQAAIHVSVDGVPLDNEVWSALEGGDSQAQNVKHRPGGMGDEIELGGPVSRSDLTVKRMYSDVLHALIVNLENAAGKRVGTASYTPLDADGNVAGQTITYSGVLKSVTRPNAEANSNAAAELVLVFGVNEKVVASQN